MSDKPAATAAPFQEEIILIAEKLGELSERFGKIEAEFTAQTAPIDASKGAMDGAVAALQAALAGIKALDSHVLSNDLGKVSKRVDEIAAQADTALKALDARLAAHAQALATAKDETAQALASRDAQRMELAQKREADAAQFAQSLDAVRADFSKHLASLAEQVSKFATPSSFNPRGVWKSSETYRRLDVVSLNGNSYVSQVDGNTEKPAKDARNWMLLASRGAAAGGGGQTPEPSSLQPLTAGASITWDLINPVATVTLGSAANAFTFNNGRAGGTYILIVKQDGSGSRTVTWPSTVRWPGNVTPTLTTTASRADVFSFVFDGAVYYGTGSQNFVAS